MKMKKIVTVGATTLTALTLLGVAQPLAHADQNAAQPKQTQNKLASVQQKADTDVVNIPDTNLKTAIKTALKVTDDNDLTVAKMGTLTTLNISKQSATATNKIKDLTGLEYCTSLTTLTAYYNDFENASLKPIADLPSLTKIDLGNSHVSSSGVASIKDLILRASVYLHYNQITDLTSLSGGAKIKSFNDQVISEAPQEVKNGSVSISLETLKNIDGSVPAITVQNNGKEEGGNVVWDRLPSSTTQVTYKWVVLQSPFLLFGLLMKIKLKPMSTSCSQTIHVLHSRQIQLFKKLRRHVKKLMQKQSKMGIH
jgi:Leucine-rich repeat (LRR) protein